MMEERLKRKLLGLMFVYSLLLPKLYCHLVSGEVAVQHGEDRNWPFVTVWAFCHILSVTCNLATLEKISLSTWERLSSSFSP